MWLFADWFLGMKYVPNIFNGNWNISYMIDKNAFYSFENVYLNYLVFIYGLNTLGLLLMVCFVLTYSIYKLFWEG